MQNQTIERTTLTNLLNNEEYTRKVLPFIKSSPKSSFGTALLSTISNSNLNGILPSFVSSPSETFPYL